MAVLSPGLAVSLAQALAIVVASPALLAPRCGTIEEMGLVNLLGKLRHHSMAGQPAGSPPGGHPSGRVPGRRVRLAHGAWAPTALALIGLFLKG